MTMEKWIFNPFIYIAGWKALYVGLVFIIITSFAGHCTQIHFDGPLSLHHGLDLPFYFFLFENIIAWLLTAAIFYLFGLILSKSSIRFIDVAGTIAFARVPVVLTSLGILPWFKLMNTASLYYVPFTFLYLLPTLWIIILYFNAYSISCNVKGIRLIISFIAGIFIAEIISKITVIQLYKLLL
jgi:hypothetical protein